MIIGVTEAELSPRQTFVMGFFLTSFVTATLTPPIMNYICKQYPNITGEICEFYDFFK